MFAVDRLSRQSVQVPLTPGAVDPLPGTYRFEAVWRRPGRPPARSEALEIRLAEFHFGC